MTNHVQFNVEGKVHALRFSWITACGRMLTDGCFDVDEDVTCKKCREMPVYDAVVEREGIGVLIARDRDIWWLRPYREDDPLGPQTFTLQVHLPVTDWADHTQRLHVTLADLPEAISLAESVAFWFVARAAGHLFAWPSEYAHEYAEVEPLADGEIPF